MKVESSRRREGGRRLFAWLHKGKKELCLRSWPSYGCGVRNVVPALRREHASIRKW